MNILRKMLIGLAGFLCIAAISGFVSLLTLKTTIMDRDVVKDWFSESKIYDGKLISALAPAATGEDNQQLQAGISVSPDTVKTALNATFTPDFVRTQSENIITNAYDWAEGKVPEFTFSIPVDQKRDELIAQLAQAIEP